jgi:hypothetical protein
MLPPTWTDPTVVAQELVRVENRQSVIEDTLRRLVAVLSTTRDTRTFHHEEQHAALVELCRRTNIPLSLTRSPEFIRYAHVMCPRIFNALISRIEIDYHSKSGRRSRSHFSAI